MKRRIFRYPKQMRIRAAIAVAIAFSNVLISFGAVPNEPLALTVSIIRDKDHPPDLESIRTILFESRALLKREINFEVHQVSFEHIGNLTTDQPGTLTRELRGMQSRLPGEINILFTNSGCEIQEEKEDPKTHEKTMVTKNCLGFYLGGSNTIVMYRTDYTAHARSSDACQSLAVLIFRHEVGHLLGLDHNTDPESVMFEYCDVSLGAWTEKDFRLINRSKPNCKLRLLAVKIQASLLE